MSIDPLHPKKEKMKMIREFKDLITSVDVLNTINGGISEPYVSFRQHTAGREIHITVPGVGKDAMQVEINNNELSVYYLIPVESSGKLIQMPQVIHRQKVPHFIDANGIKASRTENELVVRLPFNKRANGHNRKIQIDQDPE
jgi:HSP20 family molecular chaperone IbpA